MSSQSRGYNMSVGYSYGFFREMAPDWLDLCVRLADHRAPARSGRSGRYLELGCGQGLGLCILAASNPDIEFLGIDLQPDHIAHAQALASAAGLANVRFVEEDFARLAADWPFGAFDYVALHGVLSWISASMREFVVRCLFHATHPGSLVYASYNAQPGWVATIPFQHISRLISETSGEPAASVLQKSTGLFDRLAAARAPIFQVLPALKPRVDAVKSRDENYFIHEYLNGSWEPLWHSEVASEFRSAQLNYAAAATMAESLLPAMLQPALRSVITEQFPDDLREDVQDLVINQAFRRDIFCRGARGGAGESVGDTRLYLIPSLEAGRSVTFQTAFGQMTLDYSVFGHIVEALAEGPRSIDELMSLPDPSALKTPRVIRLLLHASILGVGAAGPRSAAGAQRLNEVIARAASDGTPYSDLAAAALGSGIHVTAQDLAMISAWVEKPGGTDAATLAERLSYRLSNDESGGETVESLARRFIDVTLPRYRQLGVLE
jgi:SAM-dependent methyltransferase